tara:strand:+ start:96 stop:254 length:159 start_codon:yes stop_codon:yes gene_type:complete
MDEQRQNIISLLEEAIDNQEWELVVEVKNLLENDNFDEFIDDPLESPDKLSY